MPACGRKKMIRPGEVQVFHCRTSTVRQAFLCGEDFDSGEDYSHRKTWVRDRLQLLAGVFGIDVCKYAMMDNHLHLILRTRPDVVLPWDDHEVAYRWLEIDSQHLEPRQISDEDREEQVKAIVADKERVAELRERLASPSWFMRYLCEPLARACNKEDGCTGRFWSGRFKCSELLDDEAALFCSGYVDLNAVRAGKAETPETSQFTSAYDRIHSELRRRLEEAGIDLELLADVAEQPVVDLTVNDEWLCPIERKAEVAAELAGCPQAAPQEPQDCGQQSCGQQDSQQQDSQQQGKVAKWVRPARCSDDGFLPMTQVEYLGFVDFTGRQLRADKRGAIPANAPPIVNRLEMTVQACLDCVQTIGHWTHSAVGVPSHMRQAAAQADKRSLHGIRRSRELFGDR